MYTPAQIAESYLNIGVNKVRQNPLSAFLLAVMAGMMIALAGAAATVGSALIENPSAAKLVSAAIFPAGLVMVLIGGSELFTGNCMLVIPLGKNRITFSEMMKSWVIVYAGNLVGGLLVSALFVYSHTPSLIGGKLAEDQQQSGRGSFRRQAGGRNYGCGGGEMHSVLRRCPDARYTLQSAGLSRCMAELCGHGCRREDHRLLSAGVRLCGCRI